MVAILQHIKRKHEWLGYLYQHYEKTRVIIDNALSKANISDERRRELIEINHYSIPAFMNLGCGIPGECYSYFTDSFEKLDATDPYDNGLSLNDVSCIEFETSRKGTAIQMRFVSKKYDLPYRIVGFAALENTDQEIHINKGWQMTNPFEIG